MIKTFFLGLALALAPYVPDNVTIIVEPGGGGGGVTDFIDATYNIFAYYPLDTGAGVCDDEGGSSHDLTETGTIVHSAGLARGESLDNNAGNNFCQATLSSVAWPWNDTGAFSFGLWFEPQTDQTNVRNFVQLGSRTEIREPGNNNGGNAVRLEANNSNWHPADTLMGNYSTGTTYFVYMEYDGAGNWKWLVNGGTATPTGGGTACTGTKTTLARTHTADTNDRLTIGGPGATWDGEGDELAIFDGVMTEGDICLAYQQGCWGDGGSCS